MAKIPADATMFWNIFVEDISQLIPKQSKTGDSAKIVEDYYGLKIDIVKKVFQPKDGNYQKKLSDEEMMAFNEGQPSWAFKKVLLKNLLCSCTLSKEITGLGIDWRAFDSKIDSVLSPDRTLVENWQAGLMRLEKIKEELKKTIQETAAHFIGKITHSSVRNGAIIVHPESNPYPYLYSSSIGLTLKDLDRATGQNSDANIFRNLHNTWKTTRGQRHDDIGKISNANQQVADLFEQALTELETGEERDINSFVDYRLKQLKIPRESEYVVITPLAAAGISKRIVEQEKAILGNKIIIDVGGAKYINVSEFHEIRNAFVYNAPNVTQNPAATTKRIMHKGFYLNKNKKIRDLIDQYSSWLGNNSFVDDRSSYLASKIEENHSTLSAIVQSALEQYDSVADDIQNYLSNMLEEENSKVFIEKLKQMGLIEHSFVDQPSFGIASAFARLIVDLIDGHTFKVGSQPATCNLSVQDRSRLLENIQQMLNKIKGWG